MLRIQMVRRNFGAPHPFLSAARRACHRKSCPLFKESSPVVCGRLPMPGINYLAAEITPISQHGLWLLLGDEEPPDPVF